MPSTLTFAAELIAASCSGLAAQTARDLQPGLADPRRYGRDPLNLWREHMEGRLTDLVLALQGDDSERFLEQVAWAKLAFAARQVPTDDLRHGLRCLVAVLDASLPEHAALLARAPIEAALLRWDSLGVAPPASTLDVSDPRGTLAARYLMALFEGDRRRASALVTQAVTAGTLSVADALVDVCLPACKEVGRMWHLDEITIAEEHFVTRTTARLMAIVAGLAGEVRPNGRTVVACALTGDDHDLGLQVVCELLELDGWRVVCLGCGVPVEDVAWATEAYHADLLLLAATLPRHVPHLGDAIQAVRCQGRELPVLVGGPAFTGHAEDAREIDADALAVSARDVVARARALVGLPDVD